MMMTQTTSNTTAFTIMMMTFTMMSITTMNWVILWLSLEIAMMMFIPLMKTPSSLSAEATFKYFIIQSVSSNLMIIAMMIMIVDPTPPCNLLLMTAMLTKMGVAPFHMWLPPIALATNWTSLITMLTVLKIPMLLMMMSVVTITSPHIWWLVTINGTMGAISALNQTTFTGVITYSSITHTSWMIMSSSISATTTYIYVSQYIIMLLMLMLITNKLKLTTTNQLNKKTTLMLNSHNMLLIILMSLNGVPPLLGFTPKWMIIMEAMNTPLMVVILMLTSMVSVYYYFMMVSAMIMNSMVSLTASGEHPASPLMLVSLVAPTPILMKML